MRSFWWAILLCIAAVSLGGAQDLANKIYNSAQNSVFLVYLNGANGNPDALGSAFLVAPRVLVTNAHVAEAGSPVLAVGPVRIPLKIIRIDRKNDLATLSADADLTSTPLPLASVAPHPGDQIFAIGNPEGLEKTISEGIISGIRRIDDRSLLQITSPISHGSSGGPILNPKGEVVGVAVGMLEDGQNLNFAVPVTYVRSILQAKTENTLAAPNASESVAETKNLFDKRQKDTYSSEPDSDYQKDTQPLLDSMNAAVASVKTEDGLRELVCLGTKAYDLSDDGIRSAQELVQSFPSPANRALLSYALYDRSQDESFNAMFAKKGSKEETQATAAHDQYLYKASQEATAALRENNGRRMLVASFVLADVDEEHNQDASAISLYSPVAEENASICGIDLSQQAYRNLITETSKSNQPDDSEKWFRRFASQYNPTVFDWDSEGDRRYAVRDFGGAADAYERAASNSYYSYDYCYAAEANFLRPKSNQDGVLTDGRKCVEASVKQTGDQDQTYFTSQLPVVYKYMAMVLEERGVYPSALEYIKQSINAKSDDPFALNSEATIFSDLQRYPECIAAAQGAIQISDGKFPWMQFQLGYCYFATDNWTQAAASFRIAAEADPNDAVSAFNLGLCLSRQGYDTDAQQWFREALKRKPDEALRTKILSALH